MEQSARRLITTWGLPGSALHDYSARHWAGLVAGFYLPRLRLWLAGLEKAIGGTFDDGAFMRELGAWEERWILDGGTSFADLPSGDALAVARRLLEAHGGAILTGRQASGSRPAR